MSYSVAVWDIKRWHPRDAGYQVGHRLSFLAVVSDSESCGYSLLQVLLSELVRQCCRNECSTKALVISGVFEPVIVGSAKSLVFVKEIYSWRLIHSFPSSQW